MSYKCLTSQSAEKRYARAVHVRTVCASHLKEPLIRKSFELTTQNLASGCHLKSTIDRCNALDGLLHCARAEHVQPGRSTYYKDVSDLDIFS